MTSETHETPRPSRRLVIATLVFVLLVAAGGYATYGNLSAWRGGPPPAAAEANSPEAQIAAMVGRLETRLKSTPEDAEGWSMLGRSYNVLGRYAEADAAFRKVTDLRPTDAQGWADRADALAMANGRKLAGEPETLIARALELDPKNLKALALAGTIAFDRADYATAVRHWEAAVAAGDPGSELVRNLQGGVAEARARAGAPTARAASAPAAASVAGRIALAPELNGRAAPDDTVFVFARAVDGPRVPLAVLRKKVRDLPFEFVLDDSMAMKAALRLSSAALVVVSARISKSGNAVAQPGDLQGATPAVRVGTRGLQIVITETVK